ncbi:MAG TPA: hypothetical protein VFK74_05985, partial [Azospira sp.]|nr:hypothetical protein [Azospira sp.]
MSRPPSPPLTYGPAYLGLYACLLLAVLCNSFLDIRYGSFGVEAIFWGLTFALTLGIGWRQGGIAGDSARSWQKGVLVLMGVLFLLVFMPMWGMPRAGVYLLCGLQAAQNCITTTRRHFQFGLLVSAVLVLFASSHLRADWTLLFYVLPYVLAVVLTLVAEQVARRSREVQQRSLGGGGAAGQGLAVVSAAAVILALAALFYGLTPQETWLSLSWRHGLPGGAIVGQGEAPGGGGSGGAQGAGGAGGQGGGAAAAGPARSDWPSVAEMREAARRPGMPGWQAAAINALADAGEGLEKILAPLRQS